MHRPTKALLVITGVVVAVEMVFLLLFIPLFNADQYQAFAAGIQTVFVTAALAAAVLALLADGHARRVDRVIALNERLTTGEVDAARRRLVDHLRDFAPQQAGARAVSLAELRQDPALSRYVNGPGGTTPLRDAQIVVRFMEAANAAREGRIVDEKLLHELVGRHAAWFAVAFSGDSADPAPAPILRLASWANDYAATYKGPKPPYIENWGKTRRKDFGRVA